MLILGTLIGAYSGDTHRCVGAVEGHSWVLMCSAVEGHSWVLREVLRACLGSKKLAGDGSGGGGLCLKGDRSAQERT